MNPLNFSLANFGTDTAISDQLFPISWKAVGLLENKCKLKVMGLTGDGSSNNRNLFKMHGLMSSECKKDGDVIYKIQNPFDRSRYIFFISDPLYLVKTLRNSLKSSCQGGARYMWNDGYDILWSHITSLYYEDLESGLHLMPKITLDHLNLTSYSKMNVHLAAQVLSTTVSNVLKEFGPRNAATF